MKARTKSEVSVLFQLLGSPARALILLELGEGPRDTTSLALAAGCAASFVSSSVTALRLAGLVETTPSGPHRVHELTPTGRLLAGAIKKLGRGE
jgi:DNA-binding HxlR family transcriptional regulator